MVEILVNWKINISSSFH